MLKLGYDLPSLLTLVGFVTSARILARASSLLWLFLRPSSLPRYLHTTDAKPAWALVTGASGGIGKQLSHELATGGFNVVLHGRNASKLERVRAELAAEHPSRSFRILVVDAARVAAATNDADSNDWAAALEDINLNVVINNAGGSTERKVDVLDRLSADRLITDASVNALFPTLLLRQLIPLLHRNGPGLIINVGSLADVGIAQVGSYVMSRFWASEWEACGVRARVSRRSPTYLRRIRQQWQRPFWPEWAVESA
jgi:17beta-estradiol 17-dehydrogenase / very-long-chain 3-oxoacyl-CoA reductase